MLSNKYILFIVKLALTTLIGAQSIIEIDNMNISKVPAGYYGAEFIQDGDTLRPVFIKFSTENKTMIRSISEVLNIEINSIFEGGIATATLTKQQIKLHRNNSDIIWIAPAGYVETQLDVSSEMVLANVGRNASGMTGENVIVGIIDSGIDFSLDDFKTDDGTSTRILFLWDQTDQYGTPPNGFTYGSEYSQSDINNGNCYQQDIIGHGTHVAGIAAGNGNTTGINNVPAGTYKGMAPSANIIFVKTFMNPSSVTDGVEYIANKAMAVNKPWVVNLSLGGRLGPKDGTSIFEQILTGIANNSVYGDGRVIVVAAGNEGFEESNAEVQLHPDIHKYNKFHSKKNGDNNSTFSVEGVSTSTIVNESNVDWFWVEIWYPQNSNMSVQLTVPGPCGDLPIVISGDYGVWVCSNNVGGIWGVYNHAYPDPPFPDGDPYPFTDDKMIFIIASDYDDDQDGYIDNQLDGGDYTVTISNNATNEQWDLYLTFSSGFKYESNNTKHFLVSSDYSYEGTITEPGNADNIITVGAVNSKIQWQEPGLNIFPIDYSDDDAGYFDQNGYPIDSISFYSSTGPTRDSRSKPEIYAPGTYIASSFPTNIYHYQWLYAKDFKHLHMLGTSMAAPHVTGAVALLLEQNPDWSAAEVRFRLVETANLSNGYELLDIYAALCEDNEEECDNSPHIPLDLDVTANENHSAVFAHKVDTSHKTLTLLAIVAAAVSCGFLIRRMI